MEYSFSDFKLLFHLNSDIRRPVFLQQDCQMQEISQTTLWGSHNHNSRNLCVCILLALIKKRSFHLFQTWPVGPKEVRIWMHKTLNINILLINRRTVLCSGGGGWGGWDSCFHQILQNRTRNLPSIHRRPLYPFKGH